MRGLGSPQLWVWGLFAIVPPEALAAGMHWDLVDPQYLGTLIVWWVVDAWVSLWILAWLLREQRPTLRLRPLERVLPAAIHAEALLDLRSGIVAMAAMVPALACLALLGVASLGGRLGTLVLAGLGLVPAVNYWLRRSLASAALLLGQAEGGIQALDWSRDRLAKTWKPFLKLALPWWFLGWTLEGMALLLGNLDSTGATVLAWVLGVPALLCSLLPIALFVADDETA